MILNVLKRPLFAGSLLLVAASAGAQDVQKTDTIQGRDVTIEREFTPVLQEVSKIYSLPSVKTVTVTKDPVNYSYYSTTVTPDLTTKPLSSADIKFQKPEFFNGYARLGFGHAYNTLGDFGYKIDNGEKSCFDINIHHLGTFGRKQYSNTQVSFNFQKQVKKLVLYGGLDARHEWFNYYGRSYEDTTKTDHNRIWNLGFHMGVHSLAEAKTQFYGQLGYELTNLNNFYQSDTLGTVSRYGMSEHRIHAQGGASWALSKGRIGFEGDVRVLLYSNNLSDTTVEKKNARGLIHLQPYYALTGKKAWVHLGVNLDLDLGDKTYFAVSPCIQTEWQAMPELFSIYANVNGHYDARTYQSELEHCRYVDPHHLFHIEKQPYTPIDMEIGFKFKPIEQLQVNVYGRYAYTLQQHYHMAEAVTDSTSTVFNGLFSDTTANEQHAAVGVSLNFNWKENIRIFGDFHYNYYKADGMRYAWDRAPFEAQLGASYRINEHWAVQLDSYFAGKRHALLADGTDCSLRSIYDINLGCTYTVNRYISFFLNVNNVANNKHEFYYGYESQGINGLIGACFQF